MAQPQITYATIGTITYTEQVAITDLTGTKWVFNTVIDLTTVPFETTFNINFNNNYYELTYIELRDPYDDYSFNTIMYYGNNETNFQIYTGLTQNYWNSDSYRYIEITGGTDATNASLIAWLEANATQQVEPQPTDKISLGNLGISKVFAGTSEVSKIYYGSTLLWEAQSEPAPDNAILTADNTYLVDSTGGYLTTTEITLVSFTFRGTTYQAEEGMTWAEFINSQYNTGGLFIIEDNYVHTSTNFFVEDHNLIEVKSSDSIIANETYTGVYNY